MPHLRVQSHFELEVMHINSFVIPNEAITPPVAAAAALLRHLSEELLPTGTLRFCSLQHVLNPLPYP